MSPLAGLTMSAIGGVVSMIVVDVRVGFGALLAVLPPEQFKFWVTSCTARCSWKLWNFVCTVAPAVDPAVIVTSKIGGVNEVADVVPPAIGPGSVSVTTPEEMLVLAPERALDEPVPDSMLADFTVPLVGALNTYLMFVAVVSAGTVCAPNATRKVMSLPVPTCAGAYAATGSAVGAVGAEEPQSIGIDV